MLAHDFRSFSLWLFDPVAVGLRQASTSCHECLVEQAYMSQDSQGANGETERSWGPSRLQEHTPQ
jgi:hypothetical protein